MRQWTPGLLTGIVLAVAGMPVLADVGLTQIGPTHSAGHLGACRCEHREQVRAAVARNLRVPSSSPAARTFGLPTAAGTR